MNAAVLRVRSRRVGLFLGLVLGLAARPGAALGVRIVTPASGAPLVAGQLVEIGWERLPDEVDEMELLLDMDSGAQLRLRLTPQLAGATRSYLWKVPNILASRARLRLRWGRDGVEVEGEPSAPFAILPNLTSKFDGISSRCGELWLVEEPVAAEPILGGRNQVIPGGADRPLVAAISVDTEVVPDETGCHRHLPPYRDHRLGRTGSQDPEDSDHRPLTIPLRT
jgi:hypothetical protein